MVALRGVTVSYERGTPVHAIGGTSERPWPWPRGNLQGYLAHKKVPPATGLTRSQEIAHPLEPP